MFQEETLPTPGRSGRSPGLTSTGLRSRRRPGPRSRRIVRGHPWDAELGQIGERVGRARRAGVATATACRAGAASRFDVKTRAFGRDEGRRFRLRRRDEDVVTHSCRSTVRELDSDGQGSACDSVDHGLGGDVQFELAALRVSADFHQNDDRLRRASDNLLHGDDAGEGRLAEAACPRGPLGFWPLGWAAVHQAILAQSRQVRAWNAFVTSRGSGGEMGE